MQQEVIITITVVEYGRTPDGKFKPAVRAKAFALSEAADNGWVHPSTIADVLADVVRRSGIRDAVCALLHRSREDART